VRKGKKKKKKKKEKKKGKVGKKVKWVAIGQPCITGITAAGSAINIII